VDQELEQLVQAAREVAQRAYSPYSGVCVGALLIDANGGAHAGCNVESASYGLTLCAERSALARAVSDGQREFTRLAIWSSTERPLMPCGACRQALYEFAPELEVIVAGDDAEARSYSLADLLPAGVRPEDL